MQLLNQKIGMREWGEKWFLSVIFFLKKSNKNKDINFEGQNDDSWLFNAGTVRTMKNGEGGPFQRLHAVPINSCESSDGSCMPHEVIPQAWMENICPTPTNSPESRDKEPNIQTKAKWDETTLISARVNKTTFGTQKQTEIKIGFWAIWRDRYLSGPYIHCMKNKKLKCSKK